MQPFTKMVKNADVTAVKYGTLDDVRRIENVNQYDHGQPLLSVALLYDRRDVCRVLLSKGASVTRPAEATLTTPFHNAALKGFDDLLQEMIGRGPFNLDHGDYQTNTALHFAVDLGRVACVKTLLRAGANPNLFNQFQKMNPLTMAVRKKQTRIVALLLEFGASPDAVADASMPTPFHFACGLGCFDIVRMLFEAGADINLPGPTGNTPLMSTVMTCVAYTPEYCKSNIDIFFFLLQCGVDVYAMNPLGETALELCLYLDESDRMRDALLMIQNVQARADPWMYSTEKEPAEMLCDFFLHAPFQPLTCRSLFNFIERSDLPFYLLHYVPELAMDAFALRWLQDSASFHTVVLRSREFGALPRDVRQLVAAFVPFIPTQALKSVVEAVAFYKKA